MKNNLPNICYWCGDSLTTESVNREHVPAFSFFPKGHRHNLMTVPSCKSHNNNLSEIDEKFQLFIKAFKTNNVAIKDLNDRVRRGFERKEKRKFVEELERTARSGKIYGRPHFFLALKENEAELFAEKIVRGIYFYHKQKPTKGIIQSVTNRIIYEGFNTIAVFNDLKKDLTPNIMKEGDYNNPEVFKYRYLDYGGLFTIFMQFYDHAEFIGIVYPDGFSFD
ncbi:HNH endonuclease [Sphingobacterium sp. SRCM116780]|uniref:HNH endonuclease n=1 Tax=Sphingobacterium sp. SRCM116780 TaxID=2907623 RepID=UPI001F440694|nr:HNH endonuclease [Sphingobacterium sp. SRCM116780]UIR57872.1 HNH endonuclease [Sphingobacterium sp. SRCM116780]